MEKVNIQAKKKEDWKKGLKEYFDMLEEETVDGVIDFDWLLVRTEVEARISGLLEAQALAHKKWNRYVKMYDKIVELKKKRLPQNKPQ